MKKLKILLIEDDAIVAYSTMMVIKEIGHEVTYIAHSGEEAIELLKDELPDLTLIDMSLAGRMDGIELAGRIKADYDIPLIVLTAYSDNELEEKAKKAGCRGYLIKPVDPEELRNTFEQCIEKE
jgi:CheY-like chemotaxis protein